MDLMRDSSKFMSWGLAGAGLAEAVKALGFFRLWLGGSNCFLFLRTRKNCRALLSTSWAFFLYFDLWTVLFINEEPLLFREHRSPSHAGITPMSADADSQAYTTSLLHLSTL